VDGILPSQDKDECQVTAYMVMNGLVPRWWGISWQPRGCLFFSKDPASCR